MVRWVPSVLVMSGVVAGYVLAKHGAFMATVVMLPSLFFWDRWFASFLSERVQSVLDQVAKEFESRVSEILRQVDKP